MRFFRPSLLFSLLFLVLFSIFTYNLFLRFAPWGLQSGFKGEISRVQKNSSATPNRIVIPSLSIDVPVIESELINNKFQTTKNGVSYLSSSAIPGQSGNAIFYGHNWPRLLGKLSKIHAGDVIRVYNNEGEFVEYVIQYTAEVKSDEVHILGQTEDTRLTIYTCSGFLDTKRFVAVGQLL